MAVSFNATLTTTNFVYNTSVLTQRSLTKVDGLPTDTYLHRETPAEALGRTILRPVIDAIVCIANRLIPSFPVAYAQEIAPCEDLLQKSIDKELQAHELMSHPKKVRPNIFIHPSLKEPNFPSIVESLVNQIESNPVGSRLMKKLERSNAKIFIRYSDYSATHLVPEESSSGPLKLTLHYSPLKSQAFSTEGKIISNPPHVRLFHDLLQADHYLDGGYAMSQECDPIAWNSDEEYDTVIGLPSNNREITENTFRKEEGLPERFGYISPTKKTPVKLVMKRIKALAKIHQENRKAYPTSNLIAKRSRDEGLSDNVLLYTKIIDSSIDRSSSKAGGLITLYLPLDATDEFSQFLYGRAYRILPVSLIEPMLKELLVERFPKKLRDRSFGILSSELIQLDIDEADSLREFYEQGG